ncbi:MAG: ATP-binding cassette domain-containing protein [Chlorobiales bacterium]|jgi:putative tryptophan/tyrosine transport system ATP-binding protein|nr:ATP-binding cassette domain-containing protein [Chlorobiales bacterium]
MIRVENFSKTFGAGTPNEIVALKNISLEIAKGQFVLLIGTNGSGKSTLLNAIAGAAAGDNGTHGRILIDQEDVTDWPDYQRAKLIGRVFQSPFLGTAPTMTIAENLQLACLRGKPKTLRIGLTRSQISELKKRLTDFGMGLENRLDTPIGLLSGGQRQALTLLMATFVRPKVLLLDEHTAALDPRSAEQVMAMTEKIILQEGLTALMVTHSMAQALSFGTRLIMLNEGQVVFDIDEKKKRSLTTDDLLKKFRDMHIHIVV